MSKELLSVNQKALEKTRKEILREQTLLCLSVAEGLQLGLAPKNEEGQKKLALCIGDILSFVLPGNGEEKFLEDLDQKEISETTKIEPQKLEEILKLMVDHKFVISREQRRKLKNKGTNPSSDPGSVF